MILREFFRGFHDMGVKPDSKKYITKVIYYPTQEIYYENDFEHFLCAEHIEMFDMKVRMWTIEYDTIVVVVN